MNVMEHVDGFGFVSCRDDLLHHYWFNDIGKDIEMVFYYNIFGIAVDCDKKFHFLVNDDGMWNLSKQGMGYGIDINWLNDITELFAFVNNYYND